ncbi:HlyD family efflux transporter periplasmic adaptor subunit [Galbibacter sp. BG1]|uniref:HlyD family secretion protein n=1 Tax=Galbibacter sp. BG1 TaxID=1170699 RepID=UPI0015BA662D|nr:HlyD family efflux transporter periplasmic adaptor subunit [Galbibacter sp. BG1]QLE00946.1 HlyD family efflux transporter periplasmic adaptor subunit [Galbibacter sp. BG1]
MQIFPKEILDNTTEVFRFKHSTSSKIIYSILLLGIIIIISLLPIINVDVYTSARGILKPNKNRVPINVINTGQVTLYNIENNKAVNKGDTLLIINDAILDQKLELSKYQINQLKEFEEDLNLLVTGNGISLNNIKSAKYQKEFIEFQQKQLELKTRLSIKQKDYNRNKILVEKGVIAQSEFDNIEFEYELAKNNIYQYKKQQQNTWQANLTEAENQLESLLSDKNQIIQNKSQYIVTAPLSGTLLNTTQLEVGSYISIGAKIAEISPATEMIAECFISPADIGFINDKDKVSFQVDAFNYNQWGLVEGKIKEIGNDIEVINDNPVFKIVCEVDQDYLELKNGFQGKLKKGMTLNAQFLLTKRTLFDLLYDKVDDWLNPSQVKIY